MKFILDLDFADSMAVIDLVWITTTVNLTNIMNKMIGVHSLSQDHNMDLIMFQRDEGSFQNNYTDYYASLGLLYHCHSDSGPTDVDLLMQI